MTPFLSSRVTLQHLRRVLINSNHCPLMMCVCAFKGMKRARSGKPISDWPRNTIQTRIRRAGYVLNESR